MKHGHPTTKGCFVGHFLSKYGIHKHSCEIGKLCNLWVFSLYEPWWWLKDEKEIVDFCLPPNPSGCMIPHWKISYFSNWVGDVILYPSFTTVAHESRRFVCLRFTTNRWRCCKIWSTTISCLGSSHWDPIKFHQLGIGKKTSKETQQDISRMTSTEFGRIIRMTCFFPHFTI